MAGSWLMEEALALLAKAEALYLPRIPSHQFLGVILGGRGPMIEFPIGRDPSAKYVRIVLTPEIEKYADQARYQLAHEVIHLLSPNRNPPTTMMEEGLAVHFSLEGPKFDWEEYRALAFRHLVETPEARTYRDAFVLYQELVSLCPDAIVRLRQIEPAFMQMTPKLVRAIIPQITDELLVRLFERREMRQ